MKAVNTDILVSGGGTPGLLLALLASQLGLTISVTEPYPPLNAKKTKPGNRTSALMQGSINVIKAAGVDWDKEVTPFTAPLQTLRIIDETGRRKNDIKSDFEAHEIGMDSFAENVPNNVLQALLWEKCKKVKNIQLIKSVSLEDFESSTQVVSAKLSNGKKITAKLLIGADGRQSKVRDIADIKTQSSDYKQSAITLLIEHSHPHNNISTEFHRPTGPFTLVPLPNKQSSVVWVTDADEATQIMELRKEHFEERLQLLTQNILGKVTPITSPSCFPLIGIKAKRLQSKRVALIAEAAHVLHPMGAQGLNLSIRDVATLAELLADNMRLGLDIGSQVLLEKYEKQRSSDIESRAKGTFGLAKFLNHEIPPLHAIRRLGLQTVSKLPFIKHAIMKQGLAPDLNIGSRLLHGDAL